MAHQIETMTYIGSTPWHGLGKVMAESAQWDLVACQESAGLNWDAEKVPLVCQDDNSIVIPDQFAVRRTTDKKILGVVGKSYNILQNKDAFEWFEPFLASKEASLHTAGSLAGGSRVWILAKLNRAPMVIAKGDEVEKYLLLAHAHDGTLKIRCGFTPTRVVCQNTLSLAIKDKASSLLSIKHTKNSILNLEKIREIMNLANEEFEATAEQYRHLASKEFDQDKVKQYVKILVGLKGDELLKDIPTRTINIMDEIMMLIQNGQGNTIPGVAGTWWSAYNGYTEYASHIKGRTQEGRLNNMWFGAEKDKMHDALNLALDMAV